jgi:DNA-binding winged helix-turn-helix (wHTH) protein/Tol biopolymer transport system component
MPIPSRDVAGVGSGSSGETRPTFTFGPFRLDPSERLLLRGGQPVALTPKAFDLLVHLVEHPGRLVEKQALMGTLWPDTVVEEANLAYTVSALRKALGDGQEGEQFIQTVPTRGYRFVAPVAEMRRDDPAPRVGRRGRGMVVVAAATGVAVAVGAFVLWRWMESNRANRQVVRFELTTVPTDDLVVPAISPDGSRVVYSSRQGPQRQLYLRALDNLQPTVLPGTAGADDPFFSPDARAIGFFLPPTATAKGALMTLELATNRLTRVCDAWGGGGVPLGASWGADGRIYFGAGYTGLRTVPASGGTPVALTTPRPGEGYHGLPQLLPGGRRLMFVAWRSDDLDHAKVEVLTLDSGERQTILEGVVGPRYLATGHLTYIEKGGLFAVRFDPDTLRISGAPVQVLADVAAGGGGQPFYAASATGTLLYHPGRVLMPRTEMSWVSGGTEEPIDAPPGYYTDPSLSPDDRWLAVAPHYGAHQEIWVHDFVRGTWTRPSTQGFSVGPLWHPLDPTRIVFTTSSPGQPGLDLFSVPADGSSPPELVYASAYPKYACSSSSAGRLIAFLEMHPDTKSDVWLLDLRDKPVARPFVQTPDWEGSASLSPDGRWVAYASDESRRFQIYVRPVSGAAGKWQVSTEGGSKPRWSRDGRRIVYRNPQGLWAVDVMADTSFSAGRPRMLVEGRLPSGGAVANYDVSADNRRIVLIRPAKEQPTVPLVVVQNWFAELGKTISE